MKKIIILPILSLAFLLGSCGSEEATENNKVDKHQKALDDYEKVAENYNKAVDDICACIEENGSKDNCNHLYNKLSFDISEETIENLSDDEMSFGQLIEDGNARIDECAAKFITE